MTARRHISRHHVAALLLVLCVGVYQTAHSVHDILHWHPDHHADAMPSFSDHLPEPTEDDHSDWAENLLCTVCAAGLATKAAPPTVAVHWPPARVARFDPPTNAATAHRSRNHRLPPARAPPVLFRIPAQT